MRLLNYLAFLIIFSGVLSAQFDKQYLINSEREAYKSKLRLAKKAFPGDNNIDVKHYKLDLQISYESRTVKGSVTVNFQSVADNLKTINLDMQQVLTLDSLIYRGKKVAATHSNNMITIPLGEQLSKNQPGSLTVYYHGTPSSGGLGSFIFSQHSGQPIIWTLSEPYGSSEWWPCKDNPSDKADSIDVWVTCPAFYKVVSNGRLISDNTNPDGSHTVKWKSNYPIANYLVSLAMTNYSEFTDYFKYSPTDSMPVRHYCYPEKLNEARKTLLKSTTKMLKLFSDKFGLYPFIKEKYGHAEFGWNGGMEHQTITSLGSWDEGIISHELGHQWFGDKVTCKDWRNIWINEGFATYMEGVYDESNGQYAQFVSTNMFYAKLAKGSLYVQDVNNVDEIFDYYRSYCKGGIVLHMLRGITGDEKFYKILYDFINHPEYAYSAANTEDFQAVCEKVYGQSLDYFFKQWVYGENYPIYYYNWNKASLGDNKYAIKFILDQKANSNPEFFTMPVQLKIATSVKDTIVTLFNNSKYQEFSITVNGDPSKITLDPNNWILKTAIYSTTLNSPEWNSSPENFQLMQNYPNPFNPETNITFTLPEGAHVTLTIFDMLGRRVSVPVNEFMDSGLHTCRLSADGLTSGVYIYKLKAGKYTSVRKMVVEK